MTEYPVLLVREWQTVVMHAVLSEVPTRGPRLCITHLPAIVCSCGLYLIEVGDDGLGPRAVGPAGEFG